MEYQLLKAEQKALEINLNDEIYGTLAEIGAGQEVARNFFQAGAAANTIAKTMSAYDKTYSDAIYGVEESGRYVCESRLYKMLDHEWQLIEDRLKSVKVNTNFFVFADTVTTINYSKTIKGQGWLGLRFQLSPGSPPNEMVIHAKMTSADPKIQQESIGVLGVNMIFACYYYHSNPDALIRSLHDGIQSRVNVDLVRLIGPDFINTDNRLLSYYLVKYKLTEVSIFDKHRLGVHASEFLYKRSLMVVRGNFRPPTKVTIDVFESGMSQFKEEELVNPAKASILAELTLENLQDKNGNIDERDFLQRAEMLCLLGYDVMVSDCTNHQMLINYMSDYKIPILGLVIGARELLDIINDKYYQNQDGRLLVAFGELFTRNIKIYVYPLLKSDGDLVTAENLPVPEGITFLYKHLLNSEQIVDIEHYNREILSIFPQDVLSDLREGNAEWEKMIPPILVPAIKEGGFFGYSALQIK